LKKTETLDDPPYQSCEAVDKGLCRSRQCEQEHLDKLEDLEDHRPFSAWWELSLDEDQRRNRQRQDWKQKVDAFLWARQKKMLTLHKCFAQAQDSPRRRRVDGNEFHPHKHRRMVLPDTQSAVGPQSRDEYLDSLGGADGENAV
jgi:hypothetical protein